MCEKGGGHLMWVNDKEVELQEGDHCQRFSDHAARASRRQTSICVVGQHVTRSRDRPPFFDGVLHGVLSNSRMPSTVQTTIQHHGLGSFKSIFFHDPSGMKSVCTGDSCIR